jgi:uncharacterized linocin/CFP29 family protein
MKKRIHKGRVTDAGKLFANKTMDPNRMRPFIGTDGEAYIMVHTGGDRNDPKNYTSQLVNNATLRYDEWRALDQAVIAAARQRLVGFDDLRRNGLVHPLGNAMGTTVLTWQAMNDAMEATVSMDPVRRSNNDRAAFSTKHTPIPVIHADFTINERVLQESRSRGNGLDTLQAEMATRRVAEKLEDMLFGSASTLTYGGGTIYSYLTHPDINTISIGTAWSSETAENIINDVLAMKQALIDDRYYGPYMLYIPVGYEVTMDKDYKSTDAGMTQTIRQRILAIEKIQGITVVDRLPANTVLMVCMQKDVVDLIDGMPIQNVQWDSEGGFVHNYKVMTIQIPRVKSDYNGRSGIVKLA